MATAALVLLVIAQLDEVTAGVVVALITVAGGIALRAFPKTRSEAGVDRANARKADAESWALLQAAWEKRNGELSAEVQALRTRVTLAEAEARQAREELAAERAHADEQIRALIERVAVLEASRPPERVWFRE